MKSKKIISTALAFTLALSTFTVLPELTGGIADIGITASAAETKKVSGGFVLTKDSYGDYYVSDYTGNGGNITIPKEASYVGEEVFMNNTDITSVTFPEGTAKYGIGNSAFGWCTNLKSVTITGSIGSGDVNGIGSSAFIGCHSLAKVNFTTKDAYVAYIGESAFFSCYSLTSINLPSKTQIIYDNAFKNCASLSTISIPAKTKLEGTQVFGYMHGGKTADDYYKFHINDNKKAVTDVKADGKSSVYWEIAAPDQATAEKLAVKIFGKNSFTMWGEYDDDGNFNPYSYDYCVCVKQKEITLKTVKGSPAEKWAKTNKIKYKSGSGSTSSSSSSSAALDAPANLEAATSKNSVTLVWDDVKGASSYRVYIYNSKTGKYEKYKDVKTAKCKIDKLSAGTKYKFKVVALKTNSETKKVTEGEYATISVTTSKK